MRGHQCHETNTPVTMRFPDGGTAIIIETGKVKREKGTPSQRFLFNVTTRLCHWHCAWRGLCGLGECWWEKQCQRSWPSCAAESNSSATVWAFILRACTCEFSLCDSMCTLCLCVCVYTKRNGKMCDCACLLSSRPYTVCTYPPLSYTLPALWDLGQLLLPCFYPSE